MTAEAAVAARRERLLGAVGVDLADGVGREEQVELALALLARAAVARDLLESQVVASA